MNKLVTLVGVVAITLLVSSAYAQQEGRSNGPHGDRQPPTPEQIFERFDANKDGCLSIEEFKAIRDAREKHTENRQQVKHNPDNK